MIDIDGLRKAVSKAFADDYGDSRRIQTTLKRIKDGLANYAGITDYSEDVGRLLSRVLLDAIGEECLESGYLLKDVADGIVDPSIMQAYATVAGAAAQVQGNINREAGLSFNALDGHIDRSRVTDLTARLTGEEFEKVKWLLGGDILGNITRAALTDTLRENAEFHREAGIHPYVRRYSRGKCCDWCDAMQGAYEFGEQPADFWRIHKHCTCVIEYKPSKYKRADIISYVTGNGGKMSKVTEQKRIEPEDVTKEYLKNATPGIGEITYDEGYKPDKHKEEIWIAEWLHETFGGNIHCNNEGSYNSKSSDYLWNGKLWELKTPSTVKAIDAAVRKAMKQVYQNPGGIILDLGIQAVTDDMLFEIQNRIRQVSFSAIDVMLMSNKSLERVLRYKK